MNDVSISHDIIVAAVETYNPSLTYRERRLLGERRYGDLLVLVQRAIRDVKWLIYGWPLIGLVQVFLHGYGIVGGALELSDVTGAMRSAGILVLVWFLISAIVVKIGVSRLVVMERARFVLELAVDEAGAAEALPGLKTDSIDAGV